MAAVATSLSPSEGISHTNRLRSLFIDLTNDLLTSLTDVFPECTKTLRVRTIFETIIKGDADYEDKFLRRWHDLMKTKEALLDEENPEALFEILDSLEHVRDIDLRTKWEDPEFTDESKKHLWDYFKSLRTYADLYTALPATVMGKIETVATELGQKLASGEQSLGNLDLQSIGQSLVSQLSDPERQEFQGNSVDIMNSLNGVMSNMFGNRPGAAEGLLQQVPGMGNLDLNSLAQQVAQQTTGQTQDPAQLEQLQKTLSELTAQMPPEVQRALNVQTRPMKSERRKTKK